MSRWRDRTVSQSPSWVARKMRCRRLRTRRLAWRQLTPVQSVGLSVLFTGRRVLHLTSPSIVQSLPRSSGDSPDPRQPPFGLGIALSARLWIPVAFRLAAFASWVILCPLGSSASLTVGLLARGADDCLRSPDQTPSGLPRSATSEMRPGWVSSLLRGVVSRRRKRVLLSRASMQTSPCSGPSASSVSHPPAAWI